MPEQQPSKSTTLSAEIVAGISDIDRKRALLERVRVLRTKTLLSRGFVSNGKPDKVYVWVNTSENRQVYFNGLGYKLCKDLDVKTPWKKPDNTHVRGDLILYEIDKELYEALHTEAELRAIEMREGVMDSFEHFTEREGIPLHKPRV